MTAQLIWDEAVDRLRTRVSPQYYDMWLRPIEMTSFDGEILRLRCPNSYIRNWFEANYLGWLREDLGQGVRTIVIGHLDGGLYKRACGE